jgi:hypothetical protein
VRVAPLTVAVALLALGVADPTTRVAPDRPAAKRPATVLAILSAGRSGSELVRLHRGSLKPVRGRRVALGPNPGAWALSPDGKRLAIGVERALGVRIVDVTRMRTVGEVKTRNGQIHVAAWLTPRRIVGVEETGLFAIDPVARRLVRSEPLDQHPVAVGRTADALVLLLAARDAIGAARLALVDADGHMRAVVLDRIVAGSRHPTEADAPPGENWRPGLAVDVAGDRAFVFGSGAPIAEVDLASLAVRYHDTTQPASLLGRLRDWLEPRAQAKGPVAGGWRTARWLGRGLLACSGEDGRVTGPGTVEMTPAGVTLVDTTSWRARKLVERANGFVVAADTLLATLHDPFDDGPGIGLRGFTRDGSSRFHLFGEQQVGLVGSLDDRVFVDAIGGTRVVRAPSGRVSRWRGNVPYVLAGSMRRY